MLEARALNSSGNESLMRLTTSGKHELKKTSDMVLKIKNYIKDVVKLLIITAADQMKLKMIKHSLLFFLSARVPFTIMNEKAYHVDS